MVATAASCALFDCIYKDELAFLPHGLLDRTSFDAMIRSGSRLLSCPAYVSASYVPSSALWSTPGRLGAMHLLYGPLKETVNAHMSFGDKFTHKTSVAPRNTVQKAIGRSFRQYKVAKSW